MLALHSYRSIALVILLGWALYMSQTGIANGATEKAEQGPLRLYVVFNNMPLKAGLETSWGFSCLIEGMDKTVLFDTGGNGDILLSNMRHLGLHPERVNAVVLSHIHGDHTGGLGAFLARNPDVTVYMPESFPAAFRQAVKRLGAKIETVSGPRQFMDSVYTTGEMGFAVKEQALIVDTREGLILITGCAHPNVADMAEQAETYCNKNIYLLMGGFHLSGKSDAENRAIIQRLRELGVKKVAPSHCTGENAIRLFRDEWADDFLESGLGAVIEIQR